MKKALTILVILIGIAVFSATFVQPVAAVEQKNSAEVTDQGIRVIRIIESGTSYICVFVGDILVLKTEEL